MHAGERPCPPFQVREMLVDRDSDGLNLLMHAASCQTAATAASLVPVEGIARPFHPVLRPTGISA